MKFIDSAKIKISAGNGGDGAVAFLRELYVPKGGPAGGDGGKGGDVIFIANEGLMTLIDLKYQKEISAPDGGNGGIKNMHGRNGNDKYITVPVGTTIYNGDTNEVIGDLIENNQHLIVAHGGKGGRGNARFANSRNKAPAIFEKGTLGEKINIRCELKVLADVGFVGLPNAGKSTLLSVLSNSKPQIGDYPFTTLTPQLGVVNVDQGKSFVIADLPGLIKDAHLGKGLGINFLKHIQRCLIIVYVLDMSGNYGVNDVWEDYQMLKNELFKYDSNLSLKKFIIVANKMDIANSQLNLKSFLSKVKDANIPVVEISGLKRKNLDQLKLIIYNELNFVKTQIQNTNVDIDNKNSDYKLYEFKPKDLEIFVKNLGNNKWEITGDDIFKVYYKYPPKTHDNLLMLNKKIQDLGVFDILRKKGIQTGDTVSIFEFEFEWND